eukprot:PhM_4_TR4438/c0_g1_i1/m.326/K03011/RPB3, POLR2C; DNA-directed RNA polymerase II subunit RPB3
MSYIPQHHHDATGSDAGHGGATAGMGGLSGMSMHIDQLTDDYVEFRLDNADSALANSVRRTILAEVPMLAINECLVKSNSSVIHDEFLAHRIGMIPIHSTAAKDMNFFWNCPCDEQGCTRCTIEMELVVRCGANETEPRQVTASDLRLIGGQAVADVYPVRNPNYNQGRGPWICTLGPGQEVDVLCKINKGIAKRHAKWMPVATCSMQYVADIQLNMAELKSLESKKELVAICPVQVFDIEAGDVRVAHPDRCVYCTDCCSRENKKQWAFVKRKQTPSGRYYYVFRVEGIGVLPVIDVVREALLVLKEKFDRFQKAMCGEMEENPRENQRGGELAVAPMGGLGGHSPMPQTPMTNLADMVFT